VYWISPDSLWNSLTVTTLIKSTEIFITYTLRYYGPMFIICILSQFSKKHFHFPRTTVLNFSQKCQND
jgi:hypothetical protein